VSPKTQEDRDYFLKRGLELAKGFGFTTAIEGRAQRANHEALKDAAARGLIDIDVLSYIDHADRAILDTEVSPEYRNRYRAAGLKIMLGGSAPGRTAWRTTPYLQPPPGGKADYKAYGAIPDAKQLEGLVDEAYRKKWPTHIHANGDAAVDQMISAVRPALAKYGPADRRTVMIHGVLMRQDQLQTLEDLQVMPSLFPMHTFYWGDWYEHPGDGNDQGRTFSLQEVGQGSTTGGGRRRGWTARRRSRVGYSRLSNAPPSAPFHWNPPSSWRHRGDGGRALRRVVRVACERLGEVPVGLQPHPELRRHLETPRQANRGVRSDAALAEHDLVEPVQRDPEFGGQRGLLEAQWPDELLQQHLPGRHDDAEFRRITSDSLRLGPLPHTVPPI
jgi:hypothetical protein